MPNTKKLNSTETKQILGILQARFNTHMHRHPNCNWATVAERLTPQHLWSLQQMELTGGEPDLIDHNTTTGTYLFADCAPESPKGRRSLCYDDDALEARKENKPAGSALGMATHMGITLLTEAQYQHLQHLSPVDLKTSSWLLTPPPIRSLDGALFGDRRYNHVFTYHNGAQSYYAARGFRGALLI